MKKVSGKIGVFLLMVMLSVSFTGCGNSEKNVKNASETPSVEVEEDDSKEQAVENDWGSIEFYGKTVTVPCTLADLEAMDIHLYNEDEKKEMLSTPNEKFFMLTLTYGDEDIPLTAYFETGDDESKKEANVILTAVNSGLVRKEYLTYKGYGYGDSVDDFINDFGDEFDCIIANGGDELHSSSVRLVGGDNDVIVRIDFVDGAWQTVEISYE